MGEIGPAGQDARLLMRASSRQKQEEEILLARTRQQATVAQFGQRALAGQLLNSLMDDATARIVQTLGADYCAVLEQPDEGGQLRIYAGSGWPGELLGRGIPGLEELAQAHYALGAGTPLVVSDWLSETRFPLPAVLRECNVTSSLSVLLQGQERPFGLLAVYATQQRNFSQDDINFLQAMANILAACLQRQWAEEAERRARAEAEAAKERLLGLADALNRALGEANMLNSIAVAASGEEDLSRILAAALDHLAGLIAFTGGSIALVEDDELVIHAAIGRFAAKALGQRLPRGPSRSWQIIESGEPWLCNDLLAAGIRLVGGDGEYVLRSYLAVPLVWHGQSFGLLEIDSTELQAFQPADMHIMRGVAALLSGPVALARRYAAEVQARQHVEQLAAERDAILQQIMDGVMLADRNGNIVFANQAARRIHGTDSLEGSAERYAQLCQPHRVTGQPYPLAELPLLRAVAAGETIVGEEWSIRRVDGAALIVQGSASPVLSDDGRQLGAVLVLRDITAQRGLERQKDDLLQARDRALAEAMAAQWRLGFLAEASIQLAASLDYHTTLQRVAHLAVPTLADYCAVEMVRDERQGLEMVAVAHADPAREELLREMRRRYPPSQGWPHPSLEVLRTGQPQLLPEVPDELLQALARDPEHLAMLRELATGSLILVPLIARRRILGILILATAESGRRYGAEDLALSEDLARRAATAVDNARLYQEAQQALRVRDQFLSIAAHELKTPITALLGYAQLLQRRAEREGQLSTRDQSALNALTEQAQRLHRLINLLFDLSRIQEGRLSIDRAPVDLVALIRRVATEIKPTLDRHSIEYQGPTTPLHVEGDELRLEQVLQNLIQNAIKYSPSGGTVRIGVEQQAGQLCVAVADRGIGIPDEALPQLFTRFYRAANIDPHQISGMGIGLFVVKEIIALHGGSIEVQSREGDGSTFTIRLPLIEPGASPQ